MHVAEFTLACHDAWGRWASSVRLHERDDAVHVRRCIFDLMPYQKKEGRRSSENVLLPALTAMLNAAFMQGHMPDSWNVSLVTPTYKRGDSADSVQQAETLAEVPTRTQRPAVARRFQHGESRDPSVASCRGRILSPQFEAQFIRRHAHLTGACTLAAKRAD